jgi:hypothetical protein
MLNSCAVSRREFIKAVGLGAASLTVPGCASTSQRFAAGKVPNKPNIVLIMADDLGYECLGCYGSGSYKTPVLDGLAGAGMRFEHCYSQPLCTPSRVKIMTGQYNFRNYTNFGVLDPKQKTFYMAALIRPPRFAVPAACRVKPDLTSIASGR